MESEKVKEIKDKLQEEIFIANSFGDKLRKVPTKELENLLTLINELESENERVLESCKNCHYIKDLEIANGHAKELKDRIAKLEKENAIKTDTITDLLKKQEFYETEKLKQFAEKVAKRLINIKGIKEILDENLKEFIK